MTKTSLGECALNVFFSLPVFPHNTFPRPNPLPRRYISRIRHPQRMHSHRGYCFTNVMAAVYFLENMDAASLSGVSQADFARCFFNQKSVDSALDTSWAEVEALHWTPHGLN